MEEVNKAVKEHVNMWNAYRDLPFSLHHKKTYLTHPPEDVRSEVPQLFTCPSWCVCSNKCEMKINETELKADWNCKEKEATQYPLFGAENYQK